MVKFSLEIIQFQEMEVFPIVDLIANSRFPNEKNCSISKCSRSAATELSHGTMLCIHRKKFCIT